MQLMTDAISVFGSRHGIIIDPVSGKCFINRAGVYPGIECEIIAGVVIEGREVVLPLCKEGNGFDFLDQDTTPCTFKLTGIDEKTTIKLELTITSPFRPRDEKFSTIPVLDMDLKIIRLDSNFRGYQATEVAAPGKIFFVLKSYSFDNISSKGNMINFEFDARRPLHRDQVENEREPIRQTDTLLVHSGCVSGARVELQYDPSDYIGKRIHVSWCTHSEAMMTVHNEPAPFKYTESFATLEDVVKWASENPNSIAENAEKVDGIFLNNNMATEINNLMSQTLHSWMINTWFNKARGKDWFTVWEGNCYYLSTMDVEYTQSPFYLSIWPELLALELDMWPEFTHSGEEIIGEKGKDTLVFMHDVGWLTEIDRTRYAHPMPVEQSSNYSMINFAYWRRTGDFSVCKKNFSYIKKALDFIVLSDSTGDGVPDQGTANTIDDACPALQFGKKQVYLAVKSIAALECGADIAEKMGDVESAKSYRKNASLARAALMERGWNEDHFNTLLYDAEIVKDKKNSGGWDATHIYTSQGLVLLDMVGKDVNIDDDKIATDIRMGVKRCLDKYGCRHSDYLQSEKELLKGEFGTFNCPRVGWIAMNMFRDLAAFYRKIDLRYITGRYWAFQTLVNTQGQCLFFETFNGNRLMTYPRGISVFGYYDALGGIKIDKVRDLMICDPIDEQLKVPVLLLADWLEGTSPIIEDGKLKQ